MIIYKTEATNIAQENCIMLEVEGGGYIYISKDTYDQAVILNDRYEGDLSIISGILECADNQAMAIEYFSEKAPEPINVLAPFLGLVSERLELEENLEQLCGALHQMSTVINFNEILKVPKTVRSNVNFTKGFIEKYARNWESIEMKLIVTEVDIREIKLEAIEELLKRILPNITTVAPAPVAVQEVKHVVVEESQEYVQNNVVIEEEKEEEEDPKTKDYFADFGDLNAAFAAIEDDAQKKQIEVGDVKPNDIFATMTTEGMTDEHKDAALKEAEKISALIAKFGGAK